MDNQEPIVSHKSYESDSSFIVNLLYFLVWIPTKYAIIFGLVYSAFPLFKQLAKMSKPMLDLAKGL